MYLQCESLCRFGTGYRSSTVKSKGGLKKVLILNPLSATSKRGKNQTLYTTNATTIRKDIKNQNKTTIKMKRYNLY